MTLNYKVFWIAIFLFLSACSNSSDREALFATVSNSERDGSGDEVVGTEASGGIAATISSVMTVEPVQIDDGEQAVDPVLTVESVPDPGAIMDIGLTQFLDHLTETDQFMGTVLIAQNGEILLTEGYGLADIANGRGNTPQTQMRIGSLTKQFTAAAILRLQELGKLDVSDTIDVYLPDYPGGEQITIHQLLTHSAGVPNYTRRQDLAQVVQAPITLPDLLAQFANQPLDFIPGQQFAYSDSGYVLLTAIIEAASGTSYEDFLQEQFFDTLGMTRTGYDFLRDDLTEPAIGYQLTPGGPQRAVDTESSWASGAGALYSTVQDLYLWDQALNNNQVLEETSLQSMFTPWIEMGQGYSYGYGWEIGQIAGRKAQTHAGNIFGFGSFIAHFPEDNAIVIVLGNGFQLSPRLIAEDLATILFSDDSS
jgi:CubicO group peptidase (beta-lactamase class C family)